MKPIRDPELYIAISEVEDLLEKGGWIKGESSNSNGHCLIDAVSRTSGSNYHQVRDAILSAIIAESPKHKRVKPGIGVVDFNDAPETTWEDVRRVLRKARESALTPQSES